MLKSLSAYPLAIMLTISLIAITVLTLNSIIKISTLITNSMEENNIASITYTVYNGSLYIVPINKYDSNIKVIAVDEQGRISIFTLNRSLIDNKIVYGPILPSYKYLIIQNEEHEVLDVLEVLDTNNISIISSHLLPPSLYIDPVFSTIDYIDQHNGVNNYYELAPKINGYIENVLYPNLTYRIENKLYRLISVNQSMPIKISSRYDSLNNTFSINITDILTSGTSYYGGYLVKIYINTTKSTRHDAGLNENYTHYNMVYPSNTESIELAETHVLFNSSVDSGYITDILVNITHRILNASIRGLWSGRVVSAYYKILYNISLVYGQSTISYITQINTTSININNYTLVINNMFNNISSNSSNTSITVLLKIKYNITPINVGSEPLLLDLYSHINGNIQNRSVRIIKHNTLYLIVDNEKRFLVDESYILIHSYIYSLDNNISYKILINNSIIESGSKLYILLNFYGKANISIIEYALPDIVVNVSGTVITNIISNASYSGIVAGMLWFSTSEKPLYIKYRVPSIIEVDTRRLYINSYTILLKNHFENKTYIYNTSLYIVNGSNVRIVQNIIILRNISYNIPCLYFPSPINLTIYISYVDGQIEIVNVSSGITFYKLKNKFISKLTITLNDEYLIYTSLNAPFLIINFKNNIDYVLIGKDIVGYINIFGNTIAIYRTRIYDYKVSLVLSPNPPLIKYS